MANPNHIFSLIKAIESDNIRKETIILAQFLNLQSIDDLANCSKEQLSGMDVSDATLDALESLLSSNYEKSFATESSYSLRQKAGKAQEETGIGKTNSISSAYDIIKTEKYEIIDKGDALNIYGRDIPIPKSAKALPKDKIVQVFQLFGNGVDKKEIAGVVGCSPLTVNRYLGFIPDASEATRGSVSRSSGKPAVAVAQPGPSVSYSGKSHSGSMHRASGAPPETMYALLQQTRKSAAATAGRESIAKHLGPDYLRSKP